MNARNEFPMLAHAATTFDYWYIRDDAAGALDRIDHLEAKLLDALQQIYGNEFGRIEFEDRRMR